jgi:hypothetical protein
MNTTHTLKPIIAGALLSGAVAVASLGLAAGTAQAAPGFAPLARWCPGRLVLSRPTRRSLTSPGNANQRRPAREPLAPSRGEIGRCRLRSKRDHARTRWAGIAAARS